MEGKSKALRSLLMYKCCIDFMHVELRNVCVVHNVSRSFGALSLWILYIHAYIHTYIHTYVHVHTYIRMYVNT